MKLETDAHSGVPLRITPLIRIQPRDILQNAPLQHSRVWIIPFRFLDFAFGQAQVQCREMMARQMISEIRCCERNRALEDSHLPFYLTSSVTSAADLLPNTTPIRARRTMPAIVYPKRSKDACDEE